MIFSVCLRLMTQKTQQTGGNSGWQKFLWEKIDKVLTGFFAIGLQRENNGNYWTILTNLWKYLFLWELFSSSDKTYISSNWAITITVKDIVTADCQTQIALKIRKIIKTQMWTIGVFLLKEEMENSLILPLIYIVSINFP